MWQSEQNVHCYFRERKGNDMKQRKFLVLLGIFAIVIAVGVAVTSLTGGNGKEKKNFTVVTSFYPMYIATENIVDGIEDISLLNLTENKGGCLHDYQLTTEDMKKLENADVFIMNGGGMESFVEDIIKQYPHLTIIDASEGIQFLSSPQEEEFDIHEFEEDHVHGETEESASDTHTHDHGDNAHVWCDFQRYEKQLDNIKTGLCAWNASYQEQFTRNTQSYQNQLEEISKVWKKAVHKQHKLQAAVVFHDAFRYFMQQSEIDVIGGIDMDEDASLDAGEVASLIHKIEDKKRESGNTIEILLITEDKNRAFITNSIAKQTGAKVVVMNPLTSGAMNKDSYLQGMRENLRQLTEK